MANAFLEGLYYVSAGPVLAGIAFVGLQQLRITKQIAKTNARRESSKLAAEQCSFFLSSAIPHINELNDAIAANGVLFFTKASIKVNPDSVVVNYTSTKEDRDKLRLVIGEFTKACNAMEAFAVPFVSRIADESVGYSAVGQTYCFAVRRFLPLLAIVGAGKEHYINLMRLFYLWDSRAESAKLLEDKDVIERKLSQISTVTVKPIGTE